MKSIYIQVPYHEAVAGKREFLSSQIHLLQLLKSFKSYKNLRRSELILKQKLKIKLTNFRKEVRELQTDLPKETKDITIKKIKQISAPAGESYEETKHRKDIEAQLQEIREQLARLGGEV